MLSGQPSVRRSSGGRRSAVRRTSARERWLRYDRRRHHASASSSRASRPARPCLDRRDACVRSLRGASLRGAGDEGERASAGERRRAARARAARDGRGHRPGDPRALHEVRVQDPDARRRAPLHGGVRPEGREPLVSDPDDAYAVQRRALRHRRVPERQERPPAPALRALEPAAQGRLHLRSPGRARPHDVGGNVRRRAPARLEAGRRSTRAPTPTTRSTG